LKKLLALLFLSPLLISDQQIEPNYIDDDEFTSQSWLTFSRVKPIEYYQDANVWVFFAIDHFWRDEGINDDIFKISIQGNVAFANANESDIYIIDNHKNHFSFAKAYNSEYQKGSTPYGYKMGIGCPKSFQYNCYNYLKKMEEKKLVWRFYNGGRKIADIEIPNAYRKGLLDYFDKYSSSFK